MIKFSILTLFSIFLIGLISAQAVVLISPSSTVNSTISGATATLNASNFSALGAHVFLNCTFYAFSPSTANNTNVSLASITNATEGVALNNATNLSTTFNSAIL